jgi:chromosome segregation ATPase
MSSLWPSSLLNATNQRLTERIEQLSVDLASKRNSVVELRDVVELLRKNQQEAWRQQKAAAHALASKREELEKDEGRLKQLTQEIEATTRRVRYLKEQEARLTTVVASVAESMQHKRRTLEEEQKTAVTLEEQVKTSVLEHLARQRVGEELSASQRELSSAVWTKLERLNDRVGDSTRQLAEAREEHHHVLRELEAVQHNLQEAVKEQSDGVRALELVHAQSSQLDGHVVANAASMEVLKIAAQEKKEMRDSMRSALERCLAENKQRTVARDRHRSRYDAQLYTLRQLVEGVREAEEHLMGCVHRQHAEEHFLQQQRRELDRIVHLYEEKMSLLELEKVRHDALVEVRAMLLDKQNHADAPSPAALRDLILTLSRQKELLEDRLERARVKLTGAIQSLVLEGRKGDQMNEALTTLQTNRKALVASQDTVEGKVRLLKQHCTRLEELLAERRALLPSMQALAQEQRSQRQESWMRDVEQLRTTLLAAQRDHQQLLRGITMLRSSLYRTQKSLQDGGALQNTTMDELRVLEGEVSMLEQEECSTAAEQENVASQLEQANVALQSLMSAADTQVDMLKDAAGVESFLRAEVQIKEEQIQAEMQGRMVELHLHESELHQLSEELQRHSKKLTLLRMRYEEVMASLVRASQKPLNEELDDASLPLRPLDPSVANTNPEAVHAHMLLRRSFEREQLVQRGNYLDLRLVALDRETSTLRHMLNSLRVPSSSPRLPETGAGADSGASDRTKTCSAGNTEENDGVLVGSSVNASPAREVQSSCSIAAMKDQLVGNELAKEHYWKMEMDLLDETMTAMTRERDRTRVQLNKLRSTLKALQGTEQQKRMRLQKLRDAVVQSHKKANTAAMRGIK